MFRELCAIRRWVPVTAGGLLLLGSSVANAAPERAKDRKACLAARENAKQRETAGHLRAAEEAFFACATALCGNKVFRECSKRYSELADVDIPSIVPRVTDERGAARTDVEVRMDGEVLASKLDGQPLPVDPGIHEFSFAVTGGGSSTEKILIVEGQRNRPISVSIRGAEGEAAKPVAEAPAPTDGKAPESKPPSPEPPTTPGDGVVPPPASEPTPPPKKSGSALAYVLAIGGTAIAGAGAGAAIWSTRTNKDMMFLPSDIATGVAIGAGVTAVGAAIWLFATGHPKSEAPASSATYRVDMQPMRSGAVAAVSGAF